MSLFVKRKSHAAKRNKLTRFAIIATPRTGNTWLKVLLGKIYNLNQIETFSLREDDWKKISGSCILQIHTRREAAVEARLAHEGFRILTLTRHPLDVLVSILRFTVFANTAHWLQGAGGNERSIFGLTPTSDGVLAYARSPRMQQLFGVSADWQGQPGVHTVRYEELVADPAKVLRRAIDWLGPPRGFTIEQTVSEMTLDHMKLFSNDNHVWIGRPGLWRELIPQRRAYELAEALKVPLQEFGYNVDPDPNLTSEEADRNWARFFGEEIVETITDRLQLRMEQRAATDALNGVLRSQLTLVEQEMSKLHAFVESRLQDVAYLGRTALQTAYATQYLMNRFPLITGIGKRLRRLVGRSLAAFQNDAVE